MFATVDPVAPSTMGVTDDALDQIEQTFGCHLPRDYRGFLKTFGPGILDADTQVLSPDAVISETQMMRAVWGEPIGDPGEPLRARLLWDDHAADLVAAEDIPHLISIASSSEGDYIVLLPGTPPRFFACSRGAGAVLDAGTTMESVLAYLDPRIRFAPQARLIVEHGGARWSDGKPDGTPYRHVFTPEGYTPPPHALMEHELTWGHGDDGLVTWSLPRLDRGQRPTAIQFHLDHYPLLALLEAMAYRDASTRFEAEESDIPTAQLSVPRLGATLRAWGGMHGLTLYVSVPEEHALALYRWLAEATVAAGHAVPPSLQALLAG